jgi:hypothetical protein
MSAKVCVSWVLVCAVLVSGCSNTATISMADGNEYEVNIYDGDKGYVYGYVDEDVEGQPEPVEAHKKFSRGEIKDIDHPGNVQMVVGGSMFVLGAASTITLLVVGPDFDLGDDHVNHPADIFLIPLILGSWGLQLGLTSAFMLGGGGLFMEGADRWSTSRDAAEQNIHLQVSPMVTRDERGDAVVGVGLGLTW